jgi:hypothetical protein
MPEYLNITYYQSEVYQCQSILLSQLLDSTEELHLCSLLIPLKISMFYWRIVDQHSFPLDVSEFPKLAVIGAYSSSAPADVQDIISYMLNIFILTELTIKNDL